MTSLRPSALRLSAAAAAALFAWPLAAADPPAADPLDALPAGSGVVVRVSSPAKLPDRVRDFAKNAAPDFAPMAANLGPALGSVIGNPTLAGVDAGRDVYLAVLPKQDGPPAVLFAVAAKDAAAVKKAVGAGYAFADRGGWVLYSKDADAVAGLSDDGGVRGEIDADCAKTLAAGDVAFYLNVPVLRDVYRPQLEKAKEQFLAAAAQGATDPTTKAGLEYNRRVMDGLLRGIDDATGAAKRISFEPDAITTGGLMVFAEGSPSAQAIAGQPSSDFALLRRLPADQVFYAAVSGDLTDWTAEMMRSSASMYPGKEDDIRRAAERLKEIRLREMAGGYGVGDLTNGALRGAMLVRVDPAEKYRDLVRDMTKSMSHVEANGLQQDITIEPDAETVEGVKLDRITARMTFDPNNPGSAAAQKMIELMFGKNGLTQRTAVVDGLFLQMIGDGVARDAIEAARTGVDPPEAVTDARSRLADRPNILLLADLPRAAAGVLKVVAQSDQVPIKIDPRMIDDLRLPSSYLGATLSVDGTTVRSAGYLPAAQVRGLVSLFAVLQKATPQPPDR